MQPCYRRRLSPIGRVAAAGESISRKRSRQSFRNLNCVEFADRLHIYAYYIYRICGSSPDKPILGPKQHTHTHSLLIFWNTPALNYWALAHTHARELAD